jgi:5-methylcytosine-specific restriction protein A
MNKPDRTSPEEAKAILDQLMPDAATRKAVCCELSSCWQYAKRNFPDKAFITLARRYIRLNVGMIEVFVIHPDETVLVVVDKALVDPDAEQHYRSLSDALPIQLSVKQFLREIDGLRPAVFSVINKLGLTRRNPSAPIGHSPALAELLAAEYPYDSFLDFPEEVPVFREGESRTVTVNSFERDPAARAACLRHHGAYTCQICGFDFARVYGSIGREFIHVHHLCPLSALAQTGGASIRPGIDLLPVCPNCHAMLHTRKPQPLRPEELKELMSQQTAPGDVEKPRA